MWLTGETGREGMGGGSMWSKSIHYSQWFQPLICLMWYDILPRWLLVSFIHINEHHQMADWDKFPFPPCPQSVKYNKGIDLSLPETATPKLCALKCDINQKGRERGAKVHRDDALYVPRWMPLLWKLLPLFKLMLYGSTYDRHLTVSYLSVFKRSLLFPACMFLYYIWGRVSHAVFIGLWLILRGIQSLKIVSESNKQVANLNIITVMHCLVHDRHVQWNAFTLWSA